MGRYRKARSRSYDCADGRGRSHQFHPVRSGRYLHLDCPCQDIREYTPARLDVIEQCAELIAVLCSPASRI